MELVKAFFICLVVTLGLLNNINSKFLQEQKQNITNGNYTKLVFDTFYELQGEKKFNSRVWDDIYTCMKSDPLAGDLLNVSDHGWVGLMTYGQANISTDPWGIHMDWREKNLTKLPDNILPNVDKIKITEPCATVSNIAYTRTFLTLCKHDKWSIPLTYVAAVKKAFIISSMGSSFMHGSGTNLGAKVDTRSEDSFTWLMHQASLNSLPYDPILFDFNQTKLPNNSLEISSLWTNLILNKPVFEWSEAIDKLQYPYIYQGMSGIISTVASLCLDEDGVNFIVNTIGGLLLQPIDLKFLSEVYLPRLRETFKNHSIKPSIKTKITLFRRFLGTGIKLLYGVIFQEQFVKSDFLVNPTVTRVADILMPFINSLSNYITDYDHYKYIFDRLQQYSVDVYPGRYMCGGHNFSHFMWHEQTGNALVDLFYLSDDVDRVLKGEEL